MVRAANTGISAMISPWGEILVRGDQFREEVLIKEIIWSAGSLSFYSLHGDLFILAMVLLVVVHGITETVKSKR